MEFTINVYNSKDKYNKIDSKLVLDIKRKIVIEYLF